MRRWDTGQDTLAFRGPWVFCEGSLRVREVNCHRAAGGTWGKVDPRTNRPNDLSLGSNTEGRTSGKNLGEGGFWNRKYLKPLRGTSVFSASFLKARVPFRAARTPVLTAHT